MQTRRHKRYTKRIEAEFKFGDRKIVGISSDLSERGLFIRTRYPLATGSALDLTFHLPNGKTAFAQAIVRRAVKSQSTLIKSGMGVELTGYDDTYAEFLSKILGHNVIREGLADVEYKALRGGPDRVEHSSPSAGENNNGSDKQPSESGPSFFENNSAQSEEPEETEFVIIACASCGVKNKIPSAKRSMEPRCGKCKSPLTA